MPQILPLFGVLIFFGFATQISFGFVSKKWNHLPIINRPDERSTSQRIILLHESSSSSSKTNLFKNNNNNQDETLLEMKQNLLLYGIPIVSSFVAFSTYGITSHAFHSFVMSASENNWISVDGGSYEATIITPAINGPVIGSISILFGTLMSVTISTLFQRQNSIRSYVIQEIEKLRYLYQIIDGFDNNNNESSSKQICQQHIDKYVDTLFDNRLAGEVTPARILDNTYLGDFVQQLNELSSSVDDDIPNNTNLISICYKIVERINELKAKKLNALYDTFPPTHYALLTLLAGTICLTFLVETDTDVLFFLDGFQLQLCWSALIGSFTSMAVICIDLADPFFGIYALGFRDEDIRDFWYYAKNKQMQHK